MRNNFIFTSESVTEGHPDKLCDQISDAIVDRFLRQDPAAAIIAECGVATAIVFIAARFATSASIDIPEVTRQVISQIGYDQPDFNGKTRSIVTSHQEMPPDDRRCIAEEDLLEEEMDRLTVKNQATVFGFACDHARVDALVHLVGPQARQAAHVGSAAKALTPPHARWENAGRGRIPRSPTLSHP